QAPEPVETPVQPVVPEILVPASVEEPSQAGVAAAPETEPVRPQPSLLPVVTSEVIPEIKVDVRNFQVRHDPGQKLLNVQFRLKNVNVEAGAVSGRTFVVLENDQDDETAILTFPKVTFANGKPDQIHLGRYFSISRFNIVKFKGAYEGNPRPFNSATVFVYSGAGDLLLEKHFSIEDPFKTAVPAALEREENQADEAGEISDDEEGSLPNNTILNN
ncbi:MAG: hypothetical protein GY697_07055, partial [Desulfobacterales bacterium]|nr:hypothetical protein [Desulfobacterales bacterium]